MNDISIFTATLLCSRLCHELVGPLGALMNGFDMFREFGDDFTDEEHQMLSQSTERLTTRVRFYRMAYGQAGYRSRAPQDVFPLLDAILAEYNIKVALPDATLFQNSPEGALWLVINLSALGLDALKDGGTVTCSWSGESMADMQFDFSGAGAKLDDDFVAALKGEIAQEKLSAYNIQAFHCFGIAQKCGLKISIAQKQDNVTFALA